MYTYVNIKDKYISVTNIIYFHECYGHTCISMNIFIKSNNSRYEVEITKL